MAAKESKLWRLSTRKVAVAFEFILGYHNPATLINDRRCFFCDQN